MDDKHFNILTFILTFFKDIFQQNFKAQKSVFIKYFIAILYIMLLYSLYSCSLCSSLYFSSIRKRIFSYLESKALIIKTDKGKW